MSQSIALISLFKSENLGPLNLEDDAGTYMYQSKLTCLLLLSISVYFHKTLQQPISLTLDRILPRLTS